MRLKTEDLEKIDAVEWELTKAAFIRILPSLILLVGVVIWVIGFAPWK